VRRGSFVPRGAAYDRRLLRGRVRVLRGGEDALVASFALVAGAVEVTLRALRPVSADDEAWAFDSVRGLLAIDDDPTEFVEMARAKPALSALLGRSGVRLPRTPTLFETFTVAVVEQLVTTWEARQSLRLLRRAAGARVPGSSLIAAPTAAEVRAVPMWRLRELGIGGRRAVTLNHGAKRAEAIERLRDVPPDEAIRRLQTLPGVGPWTANYVARGALGYADAVPIGDCHAAYLVTAALTGERGDDDAMLEALEPFRPHRARVVALVERAAFARGVRLPRVDPHRREPWRH
jgi:3-methyladenine DNA glycosylase/8-oxoguanine DNA glycosylase